jgi:Ca2+-binding RTX toxin-like protein
MTNIIESNGNDPITGNQNDETLTGGGDSDDVINGQGGDDIIYGLSGNDLLRGGMGNDTLVGGAGDDTLSDDLTDNNSLVGIGNDRLNIQFSSTSSTGDNLLFGDDGNDRLSTSGYTWIQLYLLLRQ